MNLINAEHTRILAIAPSTRGFGFAVLEGPETLVDWGVKSVNGDKNTRSLAKAEDMIVHYQPGVLVLEDNSAKLSRRSTRIRDLHQNLIAMAASRSVKVSSFSRDQVRRVFFGKDQGTKHALAEILAKRFPEELGDRLPRRRRLWMSEDYRMDIFDAVSLGLTFACSKNRATPVAASLR